MRYHGLLSSSATNYVIVFPISIHRIIWTFISFWSYRPPKVTLPPLIWMAFYWQMSHLLSWRQVCCPKAGHIPGPVDIHRALRETHHLHVEGLFQSSVKAGVTNNADSDQSLICDVTMVWRLGNSWNSKENI